MQEHVDAARAAVVDGRVDEAIELYDRALVEGRYYDAKIVDEALPLVTEERLAERAELVRRWIDQSAKRSYVDEFAMLRFVRVRMALGDHDAVVKLVEEYDMPAFLLDSADLLPLAGDPRIEALRTRYSPAVVAGRIERFAERHLRGRALPADLRAMLVDAWSGRSWLFYMMGTDFLDPDESAYSEQDVRERLASGEPLDALGEAAAELMRHFVPVGTWQDGAEFGYWLHPDEPVTDLPPIVQFHHEGDWTVLATGASLAEALVGDSDLFEEFARHGIPMVRRGVFEDGKNRALVAVHPDELFGRVYEAAGSRG